MPESEPESPNDTLTAQIVQRLLQKGLILKDHALELETKLKSGTARPEDWNLWVELANAPELESGEESDNA